MFIAALTAATSSKTIRRTRDVCREKFADMKTPTSMLGGIGDGINPLQPISGSGESRELPAGLGGPPPQTPFQQAVGGRPPRYAPAQACKW